MLNEGGGIGQGTWKSLLSSVLIYIVFHWKETIYCSDGVLLTIFQLKSQTNVFIYVHAFTRPSFHALHRRYFMSLLVTKYIFCPFHT